MIPEKYAWLIADIVAIAIMVVLVPLVPLFKLLERRIDGV